MSKLGCFFFLNKAVIIFFVNIISLIKSDVIFLFNSIIPEKKIQILTMLNLFLFQELSKITMPVVFNEPISFLQRITEYMEYSELLDNACLCNDPVDRLKARWLDQWTALLSLQNYSLPNLSLSLKCLQGYFYFVFVFSVHLSFCCFSHFIELWTIRKTI